MKSKRGVKIGGFIFRFDFFFQLLLSHAAYSGGGALIKLFLIFTYTNMKLFNSLILKFSTVPFVT